MAKKYMTKIFVIEDDPIFGMIVKRALERENNNDVTVFQTGEDFFKQIHQNPDIVTIDYNLPGMTGLDILQKVKNYNKDIATVIVSGQEEVEVVVKAYSAGANGYIIKNSNAVVELSNTIKNLSVNVNLKKEVEELRSKVIDRHKYNNIIGESKAILKVLRYIQKVERSNIIVLVTGESGTGKELVARAVHYNSPRSRRPFVPVNMAAIPADLVESELFGHEKGAFTGAVGRRVGKFEESHRGTIFLDEIGEMDMNLQSKLLRVLQDNKIYRLGSNKEIQLDLRVIAATNKNLVQRVKEGKFREDLYYRLQGFLIPLPALRERGNDIILLARHFLRDFCKQNYLDSKTISKPALKALVNHTWPGNVRELKALIERAALISDEDEILVEDLIFS